MKRAATGSFITRWRANGFDLRMFDGGEDEDGRQLVTYTFSDLGWTTEGRRLFVGGGYRPSPLHAVDSQESIAGLLGFLALREGDTDSEYFEGYDERQLAWRDSERPEVLQLLVYEMEGGSDV
jgi:hypothetical protein